MLAGALVLIFLSQTPVEASQGRPYCNTANHCCEAQNKKFDVQNEKLEAQNEKLEALNEKLEAPPIEIEQEQCKGRVKKVCKFSHFRRLKVWNKNIKINRLP